MSSSYVIGIDPSIHGNGTFHRGDQIVVNPGRPHGTKIGVIKGFTAAGAVVVALDWEGETHPFGNADLRLAVA